jgi:hypothetical protein
MSQIPTKYSVCRAIASDILLRMDVRLFTHIYNHDKKIEVRTGDFLIVLILLGLYKRKEFKKQAGRFKGLHMWPI